MEIETTDPGLSVTPAPTTPPHCGVGTCPHCGAGGGAVDPAALNSAALAELTEIGLRMLRIASAAAEATGQLGHEQALVLDIVSRNVRRTAALNARLFADSEKTPEQLAAEWARREAIAEWARLREKKALVQRGVAAAIKADSGPGDRENLLTDLRERLLRPDIPEALTQMEVSEIVLRVCHDLGITPQKEIWSDALMAHEIAVTNAEMQHDEAVRAAGMAAAAAGADWRVGMDFGTGPDRVTKIGRFTFGPSGAVIAEEPPDQPQSAWAPDVLGRALPDFSRPRKPPDSG